MSTQTQQQPAAPAAPTVTLPAPPRGFMYVQVPEDLRKSAIQSEAIRSLCRISNGELVAGLDDDLKELTAQVQLTGKKGKVVITIAMKPSGERRVDIVSDIKVTAPKTPPSPCILFTTPTGQLVPRDPDQRELDLKVVQIDTPAPRQL